MTSTPVEPVEELPPELQNALERFRRRWRWLSLLTVLGLVFLIPLLSFGLLSLSDRVWDTPQRARWALALPVPLLVVAGILPFVKRWILDVPGPRCVATFMGRLDKRVGDRMLGAVELSEGAGEAWAGSPVLRRAAIQQVSRELADVKTEERLDPTRARKLVAGAAVVLVLVGAFFLLSPQAAENSLQRWLRPYRNVERFTFFRFSGFPDRVVVPHGEAFELTGEVRHVEDRNVQEVQASLNGPEDVVLTRKEQQVELALEGMTAPRTLSLTAGDAREKTRIEPMLRPELVGLQATVEWPEYLGREPSEVTLRRRRLEVPIGSGVSLQADISRDVQEVIGSKQAKVEGRHVHLPQVRVREDRTLEFAWVDTVGLRPRDPAEVLLIATPDQAPSVSLSGIARAVAVLEDEFLDLSLRASDDYGLSRVWISFVQRKQDMEPRTVEREGSGEGATLETSLQVSPERLGFPAGSQIDLIAYASDAYPDRDPRSSSRFRILVLSKSEHAKLVLQQMERVLAELDESIRLEALALEENRNTLERSEEDLKDPSTTDTLLDRALDELARKEQLDQTRESMENLIVEATKNEEIGDQQIAEWATISENLKQTASPSMQAASRAMQESAEAEQSASERKEQLQEAVEQQQRALDAMRHGEEELDESIVNSLSESFINRFRELAQLESGIQEQLTELLPQTIGLPADALPEDLKGTLLDQADTQEGIIRLTRYVFDDLEGFFRRTQQPVLEEITDEMESENFRERLPALEALIRRNTIGLSAGEAQTWTDLYLKWAQRLEDEKNAGNPGGSGEGGGSEEGEDLETMIALIRARERQENLRQQTRALDETYATNPTFHREAVVLADRQYELAQELQPLENRVRKAETKQLISVAAGEMMNTGVRLRRPDTGQDTIAVQTEVIELIARALDQSMSNEPNQQQQGQQSEQNAAQIMQAILEMMQNRQPGAQQPGMAGTEAGEGQTGAGDPGRLPLTGPGSGGETGGSSTSSRAGGANPSAWPGRYRGLMDEYFNAVEEGP